MNLLKLTALELGALLAQGEVRVEAAIAAAQARIDESQPTLNTFITRTAPALTDVRPGSSPLAGVPTAWKDNLCTRGVRTTCASRMLASFVPAYDATAVERLTQAGAVSLGKLNMDEFAMGSSSDSSWFGPVRNPWDPARSAGGSSGGSAAAVAAGQVWYSLGTDTGGSIRQPAAYCGITGMKPTYGAVSRYGLIAYASSMDQIGPLARSAADCAAVLDTLRGRDSRDATSLSLPGGPLLQGLTGDLRGLRIGVPVNALQRGAIAPVRAAVERAAQVLRERGAQVEFCQLPMMRYAPPTYYILSFAEASSNLARFDGVRYGHRAPDCPDLATLYARSRSQGFGKKVQHRLLFGTYVLTDEQYETYFQKALRVRTLIRDAFTEAFQKWDLLLTPTAPTTAPILGAEHTDPSLPYWEDADTVAANLAGLPALSMPCGFSEGLPIGAQLIGPPLADGRILNAAHAFQLETDYHRQLPFGKETVPA